MNSHPVTSIDHTISFGAYASQDKSVKPDECQAPSFTNSHSWAIDEVDKRCSRRTILSHARHRRGVGRVWKDVRSPPLGVNKKIISCFFFLFKKRSHFAMRWDRVFRFAITCSPFTFLDHSPSQADGKWSPKNTNRTDQANPGARWTRVVRRERCLLVSTKRCDGHYGSHGKLADKYP